MMTVEKGRQVRGVFASYRREIINPATGQKVIGLGSKLRGETITDFAPGEEERLDSLGALMPRGGELPGDRVEEAILRAINPTDRPVHDFGHPPHASAPPMGTPPRGNLTKGDTGIDPADQPAPVAGVTTSLTSTPAVLGDPVLPRVDAPDPSDTGALAEFIKAEKLNGPDTVALAEGDPDRARFVLEAEKAATGQDPRQNVAGPLMKIIEEGAGQ